MFNERGIPEGIFMRSSFTDIVDGETFTGILIVEKGCGRTEDECGEGVGWGWGGGRMGGGE